MMDGIRQMEELTRAWTDAQQKLWSDMLGMSRGAADQPASVWTRSIDVWETLVNQSLDAQAAWLRAWGEAATASPRISEDMRAWVRQGQDALDQWIANQKQLWEAWFSMARQFAASPGAGFSPQQMEATLQAWQEPLRRAMQAQAEWTERWAEAARRGTGRGQGRDTT